MYKSPYRTTVFYWCSLSLQINRISAVWRTTAILDKKYLQTLHSNNTVSGIRFIVPSLKQIVWVIYKYSLHWAVGNVYSNVPFVLPIFRCAWRISCLYSLSHVNQSSNLIASTLHKFIHFSQEGVKKQQNYFVAYLQSATFMQRMLTEFNNQICSGNDTHLLSFIFLSYLCWFSWCNYIPITIRGS